MFTHLFLALLLASPLFAEKMPSSESTLDTASEKGVEVGLNDAEKQPDRSPWFKGKFREFKDRTLELLKDRVSLGFRVEEVKLQNNRDHYIGSINRLEECQNYDPRLFMDVTLLRYWNIDWNAEITWTQLSLKTITTDGHTDGTLKLLGPVMTLNASYPNNTRFTPYGGLGAVYFCSTDVSEGWWHYGFDPRREGGNAQVEAAYQRWRAQGSPEWPNGGYTRTFKLDRTWGPVYDLGLNVKLYKDFEADLMARYTHAVIDNTYVLAFYDAPSGIRYSQWNVSNTTYTLGLKYVF